VRNTKGTAKRLWYRTTENEIVTAGRQEYVMLEEIVSPANMNAAWKQVARNKGAGGIDGMQVEDLRSHLAAHGRELVQSILDGKYRPKPVRRVEIPKDNGKMRQLGIPTVVDRVVQQAVAQVLTPLFEPQFAETSYGFRPGRGAHDALLKCTEYINQGYVWAVDLDLEKFFDTVNQSKLLQVLSNTVKDGRVISLISRFLNAGVMTCGKLEETKVGVPQGGPLSPLCANILLNELDWELERRGRKFVRYADDLVVFCRSKASAVQGLESIKSFVERKLFLKVNDEKSAARYVTQMKFLGYGFYRSRKGGFRLRIHQESIKKVKSKVKELTSRRTLKTKEEWTRSLKLFIVGWVNYFKLADMGSHLVEIDKWMRRRIRMAFLTRWKKVRTKFRILVKLGISEEAARMLASSRRGCWHDAKGEIIHKALNNDRLARNGFESFVNYYQSVARG